jgi:2-polyprenyl-3-methyl-5-hydroxy-6-metoxy-1,4-benzoquinol methylase
MRLVGLALAGQNSPRNSDAILEPPIQAARPFAACQQAVLYCEGVSRPLVAMGATIVGQDEAFTDNDARQAWNEGARAWDEFVESGKDYYRNQVHGPALLAVCEPLASLDVLDLGCGQGFFSRQLAKRGARVVAIDLAEEQLVFARGHERQEPLGIAHHCMNAAEVNQCWQEGSFDLITACMALHDMAAPGAVLQSAFGVLKLGGRMACSIPHRVPTRLFASGRWTRQGR